MNNQQPWIKLFILIINFEWCTLRMPSSRLQEANQRLEEKNILDDILNDKIYDARIRPAIMGSIDGPTNINVNLMIRSIDKIDDVKMEFSTQITFRYLDNSIVCPKTVKYFQFPLYWKIF